MGGVNIVQSRHNGWGGDSESLTPSLPDLHVHNDNLESWDNHLHFTDWVMVGQCLD